MTIAAEKQPCLTQVLLSSRRCYTFFSIKTQKLKKIIITRQALRSAETKEPSRQQHCVLGSNRHAGGGENAQLAEQCGGRTSAGTLCESTGAQNVGVLHRPGAAGPAAPPPSWRGRTGRGAAGAGGRSSHLGGRRGNWK